MPALPRLALAAALALAAPAALAQERPNLMIVFDGSGSMWGQVGGRAKIEMARQALSSVLSEVTPGMEIGMLAYGHRVRGQCSDIELMVPMGPAARTVPQILNAANGMNPRGMTPLTDAVLIAAQRMGYTEQAATVVLLTDGIETCGGDPCALGRLLAAEGIDFRAHVVGFDLTDAEQQQVSCLAEETGGLFLAANNADELQAALARTLAVEPAPAPEPEPEPVALPRRVDLILRDTEGGPVLTGRPFRSIEFQPLDEGAPPPGRLDLSANPGPRTGVIDLAPGRYRMLALRTTEGGNVIRISLPVEIPLGSGPHAVDLVIAARLQINAFLHDGQPMPAGSGRIARLTGQGWAEFAIHPVIDGAIDPAVDYGGINSRDVALPPGDYFIRGTLTQTFTRERLVSVAPGVTTTVDFDFGAASVFVDLRDPQGLPVERMRVEVYDLDAAEPFLSGRGRQEREIVPAYLPAGTWRITAREDRGGSPVSEAIVTVAAGEPVSIDLITGRSTPPMIMDEYATPLCIDTHAAHGCVVQAVTPRDIVDHLGLTGALASQQVAARYAGTWQTHGGMMALAQDGRRVWGEVHVNGGIGLVWGHVAPDGLTLRGAMDRSSSPRGVMELRIDPQADRMQGTWDHNIGRMGNAVSARRLSGATPPMTRATGTDDDLNLTMQGRPWEPAASPAFAAFMEPALAPASPDTGEDIDAMQAAAPPAGFTGIWASNHQRLTLLQEGRLVRGMRDSGAIWGQVSADGQVMRGLWINRNDWGLLEFRLDPARMAFQGTWGRLRDGAPQSRWDGQRLGWLTPPVDPVNLPADAQGAEVEAFLEPVRDLDLPTAAPAPGDRTEAAPGPAGILDLVPAALQDFVPALRRDYAHPDGRPAASAVFAAPVPGGALGEYQPGFVWLQADWCGPGCAPEILPVGGPSADEGPNAAQRLDGGGVFPALDLSEQGIVVFRGDDTEWPRMAMTVHLLDRPFSESAQLGPGRSFVTRSFGPFAAMPVEPATMDGWPILVVSDEAPPLVGSIDVLPQDGIFATMADRPGEPVDLAFARLFDGSQDARMAQACAEGPVVVHPDGLIAERALDPASARAGGPAYRTTRYQVCEQAGPLVFCQVYQEPLSAAPGRPAFDYRAAVIGGPDGSFALQDPESGRAMLYRECRGARGFMGELDRWPDGRLIQDTMRQREDEDQAALAPTRAGGPSPIPAGLWHAEAPWSDPMPPRGTAAFAERCYDSVSATWPDGQTIGLDWQMTGAGPEYQASWAEICAPSGDGEWPYQCRAQDANLSDDAGAEAATSRMRVVSVTAGRVDLILQTEYDPEPAPMVLHACHLPGGIDLTGDPRGRALARALAQVRPGLPLPVLPAGAEIPAEAPEPPGAAPFAALSGVWYPIRDGRRPALLTDDEVASACFDGPVRMHPDGLVMMFRTHDGLPEPDGHMRCGADLRCPFAPGAPSSGRPVQGEARLTLVTEAEVDACLGPQCLTLGRCPAPDWSARERASGLAARWESAIEARD